MDLGTLRVGGEVVIFVMIMVAAVLVLVAIGKAVRAVVKSIGSLFQSNQEDAPATEEEVAGASQTGG